MKLKGSRFKIGARFLVLSCLSLFLICPPSVEGQGHEASPVVDLDIVPATIKRQFEAGDFTSAVPVDIQKKSQQFYEPGITRFPRTDNSRQIGKQLGFDKPISEICLEMRRREQNTAFSKCDPIHKNSFDSNISPLKFRDRRFFPQHLNHSIDGFREIGDEICDTGTLCRDRTNEEFKTDHLVDRTAGVGPGQTDSLADDPTLPPDTNFKWGPAIKQSLMFLAIQHGFALTTQPKTRHALVDGNFFVDYYRSVKSLKHWDDGGKFFTNYVAHSMQGAFTGFIYIQNDPKGVKQRFGNSKVYWKSRTYAFLWSTFWSTQFEIGPVSQASIGNIGLYGKQTWGDIVTTPTVGTAWMIAEDAADRYLIRHMETKGNLFLKIFFRVFFNPVRSAANLIRFKEPWYRDRPAGS